jgi:hypothetical protein
MQVIQTPTADPDKFGPGLNGFKGGVNPPPTQLSPEWFDSVQQEIVNVIIGQGIALDGLQFDQLKQAIDNYVFASPKVLGLLRIDGGGELRMEPGTTIRVQSGASLLGEVGSNIEFDEIEVTGLSTLADVESSATVTAPSFVIAAGGSLVGADAITSISGLGTIESAILRTTAPGRVESSRFELAAAAGGVANTLTRTSGSALVWGVSGRVHTSAPGYIFARGFVASAGAAALQTITTSAAAPAPADGSPIRLVGQLSALMTVANTVTLQLQAENAPGSGIYVNTGTSITIAVPSAANDWKRLGIEREHAPGGQALRYRMLVTANGGSSVAIDSASITAIPSA